MHKICVTARVPTTLLLEFILRTAPVEGYTIGQLFAEIAHISLEVSYEDIENAAELLVLEGRADRIMTSPPQYLPPQNPPNYRELINRKSHLARLA